MFQIAKNDHRVAYGKKAQTNQIFINLQKQILLLHTGISIAKIDSTKTTNKMIVLL